MFNHVVYVRKFNSNSILILSVHYHFVLSIKHQDHLIYTTNASSNLPRSTYFFFFFVALDTLLSLRECKVITQSLRLWYVLENELIA